MALMRHFFHTEEKKMLKRLLDEMKAGTKKQISVSAENLPVTLIKGEYPGKTVLISAGMHSGEYLGVPALSNICRQMDPQKMHGSVIAFHCLNISGLYAHSDALFPEDGGNLNRCFPGDENGTVSQRIAAFMTKEVLPHADFIIDLHSGGLGEPLTPCLFYPVQKSVKEESLNIAASLTLPYLLPSESRVGMFSYAANVMHIPGLLLERGYSGICEETWIREYEEDLRRALSALNVIAYEYETIPQHLFEKVIYMEFEEQGIWQCRIHAEDEVRKGDLLGIVYDLFGNPVHEYRSDYDGIVMYHRGGITAHTGDLLTAVALKKEE